MFIDTTVEKVTEQEEGALAYVDATSKEKSLANYLDPPDFLARAGLEDRLDEYKQNITISRLPVKPGTPNRNFALLETKACQASIVIPNSNLHCQLCGVRTHDFRQSIKPSAATTMTAPQQGCAGL
jgi:hypothetical protein